MQYNVLDFGAVGDGKTMNTQAINDAVTACAATGGQVTVPSGVFLSGTVYLRSNVELHLEQGAVLKASSDFKDYNTDDAYCQNYGCASEKWNGAHFILAVECSDIAVTGSGMIDGNAEAFLGHLHPQHPTWHVQEYSWFDGFVCGPRPGQCLCFCECTNVRLADFSLQNTPSWGIFVFGCEQVRVHGLRITNPSFNANTDGIDLDASRYVTVSDCLIDTGDDCITVRNAHNRLKDKEKNAEYITIRGCVLSTCACAFRIGVGTGAVRHVQVSNCCVRRAANLICLCPEYGTTSKTPLEDINFSDISGTDVCHPIKLCGKTGIPVRHVTIENIRVWAKRSILMTSEVPSVYSDITVRNFDFFVDDLPEQLTPELRKFRGESLIECNNISGLRMHNVRVFASEKMPERWNSVTEYRNCDDADIRDFRFCPLK